MDDRCKVYHSDSVKGFVGELKKFACSKCTGDILLEVDHDDLLTPQALECVETPFKDPEIGFVYSNFAEFSDDFKKTKRYSPTHGWSWRPYFHAKEHELDEVMSFAPDALSVSRIWYAPNHLRAWRKSVYDAIGGHREDMRVLDDQELLARTYCATKMKHIDKCLYLYRVTGDNSWIRHNAEIQQNVIRLYRENIEALAIRQAKLNGLRCVELGGAIDGDNRYECADLKGGVDLNNTFPYLDNSVGVIKANDILEHLKDKVKTIKEIHRILAPGGILLAQVPCALSQGGYQDPTHVSFYVENSFRYYTESRFARYIDTPVRFQAVDLYTTEKNSDGVAWVVAHLVALKGQKVPGEVKI